MVVLFETNAENSFSSVLNSRPPGIKLCLKKVEKIIMWITLVIAWAICGLIGVGILLIYDEIADERDLISVIVGGMLLGPFLTYKAIKDHLL